MSTGSELRIGEVAKLAGTTPRTIRYYEEIGLLPPPERVSGQRRYDETVLRRLSVIDVAQRAGLSLDEISELVHHGNDRSVAVTERLGMVPMGVTDRWYGVELDSFRLERPHHGP